MGSTPTRPLPLLGDLPAFRADRLGFLRRLAHEQGDVARFRIGPYRVWQLSHPDHVGEVLVAHADRVRKGPVLQRARIVLGEGLLTAEGSEHRRARRLLQPAFRRARLAGYAATMVAEAERTSARLVPHAPVDVHHHAVRLTLATAGAALLGARVEGQVDLVEHALADLLSAYRLAFVPFGWRLQRLPVGPPRRLRRGRDALHGLIDGLVAERRAHGVDRGDVLSSLVLAEDDDRLDDVEIRDQALTLLLAGHETTANALAFALHLLARHPDVQQAVGEEVDAVVGERAATYDDVARLPGCRGVLAETLRLYPPSWALGREAVEDLSVDGHVVPAGDLVVLPPWVVHRDARWWPDPLAFDPGRWDAPDPQRPRWAYFPFGAGARRCIGEGFAWTEGVLALATLCARWRFTPIDARPPRLEPLITLRPGDGVWLRARPRRTGGADGQPRPGTW